jgi:DNA-binding LacI/PurR family transcriptional regulator
MENKQKSLSEQVYLDFKKKISEGYFPDGIIPTEVILKKQLGVSITTIRNAQNKLIKEGVVVKIQGKGTFVSNRQKYNSNSIQRKNIFVIADTIFNATLYNAWNMVYEEIMNNVDFKNYNLRLVILPKNLEKRKNYIFFDISQQKIDYLILLGEIADLSDYIIQKQKKIPIVNIGFRVEGTKVPVANIVYDIEQSINIGMNYLNQLNHQKIAFLGGVISNYETKIKIEHFRKNCSTLKCSLRSEYIVPCGYRLSEESINKATELLSLSDRPSAIICANDTIAQAVYIAAAKKNIKIPDDLSVIGFGAIPNLHGLQPSLTSINPQWEKIGRTALNLVLTEKNTETLKYFREILPVLFSAHQSCKQL